MAISLTNLSTPEKSLPTQQNTKEQIKKLQKDSDTVEKLKTKMERSLTDINKKMETTFGKAAKLICLLRLDMAADMLEKVDSRLAGQIDAIANALEKEDV